MPDLRYIGDVERYYPTRALTVIPGDIVAWDEPPDPWWEPAGPAGSDNPPAAPPVRGRAGSGESR